MKIISATITPIPRPIPLGMFDPMPEVVATFEDGSTRTLFSFYPDEVSSQRPTSPGSPRRKPTTSSNARTRPTSGHEASRPRTIHQNHHPMSPAQLACETPARLVRHFKEAERKSRRAPGDLLAIACQLLYFAANGLVVSRGCTRLTFEFEGYRTHAAVTLVAVTDSKEEFILALDLLQKWKPDGEHLLGDLLEKAAEAYLDGLLPQWRKNEGADGYLNIAISPAPDGTLVLDHRGHATVRTMTQASIQFPIK